MKKNGLLLLFGLIISTTAQAELRYITDSFEIMMRTGPSTSNKIINTLESGSQVEIIESDAGNGHSLVQLANGDTGYVITRFLSQETPARHLLSIAQQQLDQIQAQPDDLKRGLIEAQSDNQDLIQQNIDLTDQLSTAQTEIEKIRNVSGNAIQLAEDNEELEGEIRQLILQLDDLRIQNESLQDQSVFYNRIQGGGLIIVGLFLGWILSRSGRRQSHSWGS